MSSWLMGPNLRLRLSISLPSRSPHFSVQPWESWLPNLNSLANTNLSLSVFLMKVVDAWLDTRSVWLGRGTILGNNKLQKAKTELSGFLLIEL